MNLKISEEKESLEPLKDEDIKVHLPVSKSTVRLSDIRELVQEDLMAEILEPPVINKTPHCKHQNSCFKNTFYGMIRTGGWGFLAKGGSSFAITILLKGALFKPSKWLGALLASFRLDTIRFGAALGAIVGTYKAVLCLLRKLRGVDDAINAAIAGFMCGITLAIDVKSRRKDIALYIFAKAVSVLVTNLGLVFPHSETLAFMTMCGFIHYSYFHEPEILPGSYKRFLDDFAYHARMNEFIPLFKYGLKPNLPRPRKPLRLFGEILDSISIHHPCNYAKKSIFFLL